MIVKKYDLKCFSGSSKMRGKSIINSVSLKLFSDFLCLRKSP